MSLEECRKWIANGELAKAQDWLNTQPENANTLILLAMCQQDFQLEYWERAIQALEQHSPSMDLMLCLEQGIRFARLAQDQKRKIQYLNQIIMVSEYLGQQENYLHWKAILANTHLRQGYPQKAKPLLMEVVQLALQMQQHLVLIAQGMILCGLWLQEKEFERVSALSLQIEDAAAYRKNWIALSTVRNMRASTWLIQGRSKEAIHLLLETGGFLTQMGARAALNIIKARLGELQLLLGKDRFEEIIEEINQENYPSDTMKQDNDNGHHN